MPQSRVESGYCEASSFCLSHCLINFRFPSTQRNKARPLLSASSPPTGRLLLYWTHCSTFLLRPFIPSLTHVMKCCFPQVLATIFISPRKLGTSAARSITFRHLKGHDSMVYKTLLRGLVRSSAQATAARAAAHSYLGLRTFVQPHPVCATHQGTTYRCGRRFAQHIGPSCNH